MNMVFFDYCSLIAFREVFFVTKGHKKTRDLRREIMRKHDFCASRSVLL